MSSTISNFLGSPFGMIFILGCGLIAGVYWAYKKKSNSNIDKANKEKDIFSQFYESIKKHGNDSDRYLVRGGIVIGRVWKELEKKQNPITEEVKKFLPSSDKEEEEDRSLNNEILKLAVYKNKGIYKLLVNIPVIRKNVLDIYLISKENIKRQINAIVLNGSTAFDKVVGVWADMGPGTISDIYNLHGLDLLKQNMEENKNFAKRMAALDPKTARDQIMLEESYKQKANYYQGKKNSRHG